MGDLSAHRERSKTEAHPSCCCCCCCCRCCSRFTKRPKKAKLKEELKLTQAHDGGRSGSDTDDTEGSGDDTKAAGGDDGTALEDSPESASGRGGRRGRR